jgi:phage shock protein PspC (stress-responsive transcriptional regulator)
MELGYVLYFIVVLGFGGALLIALAAYFAWQIITHRHRIHWSTALAARES